MTEPSQSEGNQAVCSPNPPSDRTMILTCALLAVALTCAVVSFSARWGKLAYPSTYDDCGYIRTSIEHTNVLFKDGLRPFVKYYYSHTAISPGFTVLGMLAVFLFGLDLRGFYYLNAIPIFFYLLLIARVMRPLRFWHRLAWLVTAAMFPLALTGAYELHPDFAASVFLGWSVLLALEGFGSPLRFKRELTPPLFLMTAIFFKPSTMLLSMAVYGSVVLYRLLAERGRRAPVLKHLVGVHAFGFGGLGVLMWDDFLFHFRRMYTVLVEMRDIYHPKADPFDPLFPLFGEVEKYSLGPFWIVAAGILVLGILGLRPSFRQIKKSRLVLMGIGLALLVAYLVPVAVSSVRGYRQSFPLHILLFVGAFYLAALFTIRPDPDRKKPWVRFLSWAGLAALLVACFGFQFPGVHSADALREGTAYKRLQETTLDYVEENRVGGKTQIGVNFVGKINRATLALALTLRGQDMISIYPIDEHSTTKKSFAKAASKCDMILAATPRSSALSRDLPLNLLSAWSYEWLQKHPDFEKVASFSEADLAITVFMNRARPVSLLADGRALSGFDHLEGPYPDQGLDHQVRWSLLGRMSIKVFSHASQRVRLRLSCRYFGPDAPPRKFLLQFGEHREEFVLKHGRGWHDFEMTLNLSAGENRIEIDIPEVKSAKNWILFRKIDIHPIR